MQRRGHRVPAVEVTDDGDLVDARTHGGELGAATVEVFGRFRPEDRAEASMRPFGEQMLVNRPKPSGVGVAVAVLGSSAAPFHKVQQTQNVLVAGDVFDRCVRRSGPVLFADRAGRVDRLDITGQLFERHQHQRGIRDCKPFKFGPQHHLGQRLLLGCHFACIEWDGRSGRVNIGNGGIEVTCRRGRVGGSESAGRPEPAAELGVSFAMRC